MQRVASIPAIVLGALLLFLVQPMTARMLLPRYGGSAAVWTTCLLFFQVLLLAGYAYAHGTVTRLPRRWQSGLHLALLAASLACLPIAVDAGPASAGAPVAGLLCALASAVGLPYLLLAANSPLLQAWHGARRPGALPYRLFALSNLASLAGLVLYPFVVEPHLSLHDQAWAWSLAYGLQVACVAVVCVADLVSPAPTALPAAAVHAPAPADAEPPPGWTRRASWLVLPFASTALTLSVTEQLSKDLAALPLVWIAPLAAYLLSFAICFDHDRWYRPGPVRALVAGGLLVLAFRVTRSGPIREPALALAFFSGVVLVGGLFLHGELARRRPPTAHLTAFHLAVAAGGALGSAFVVLVAPRLADFYVEIPLSVLLVALLLAATRPGRHRLADGASIALVTGLTVLFGAYYLTYEGAEGVVTTARSFYGYQRVERVGRGTDDERLVLTDGNVAHGMQFVAPGRRTWPNTYYGPASGIGRVLGRPAGRPRHVAVVGLGAGSLAAYASPGDHYTFFELNPATVRIARHDFRYLADSAARIDVRVGDGRTLLEQDPDARYDLLAVDAFTGGAIPMHLLTVEAVQLYLRHLAPGGICALHVSNIHLDLARELSGIAAALDLPMAVVRSPGEPAAQLFPADWVLLARDAATLAGLEAVAETADAAPPARPWTDDYGSLLEVLK